MANPVPYIISYSFGGFQASNPTTPLPARLRWCFRLSHLQQ
ncbi:hypothetical protein M2175_004625 [Bradyrhizobium elkanii]|nr:hypothetical protein [Bradyrhizobium elkanii]MCS3970151.1 hypothetical protein [Bradyrhizobium japonicum]